MAKEIHHTTSTTANGMLPGAPRQTIHVNVWEAGNNFLPSPTGQVEVWTDRGQSVTFTGHEWLAFAQSVTDALRDPQSREEKFLRGADKVLTMAKSIRITEAPDAE